MKRVFCLLVTGSLLLLLPGCETAQQVLGGMNTQTGGLSSAEITAGLKEALSIGTQNSSNKLSAVDGFFSNAAIKILMPEEAQKVESTLRNLGLGSLVDKAILSMNRAAEEASKSATPIFVNAVKEMTITDALGILKGGDYAATDYFKSRTTTPLTNAFKPVIEKALATTDATKYWNDVFSAYNKFSSKPVNTDLAGYVTERSLTGLFYEIGQEEQKIRKDPAARVTSLLKKVFGSTGS
ncbi:MAG: DUF4197 domain-containing protein [Chitinophagaceae bacterium]|nr:DUF4197 domain-containing protein [Chitinophagaceae bacterium]MCW5929766.1 DUF4197 domain-containing protein [Chitinophagaceae bacterium]